jgi:hypothetical protein
MKRSTLGLVDTEQQARSAIENLTASGYAQNDISVLFPDKSSTRDFAHEKQTKMPEGATIGAGTGGTLGGIVGLMAGLGSLAIPGLGPFIAAGPIMAALGGGAIGAGIGGITGALVGLGVPEYEAKQYEGKVKEGGILVSVHTDSPDKAKDAKRILREAGAHDVSTTNESGAHGAHDTLAHGDAPIGGIGTSSGTEVTRLTSPATTGDIAAVPVEPHHGALDPERVNPDVPGPRADEVGPGKM